MRDMKEKIINAALLVFDRYGFYRAGIRDIAAEAGCSLPTLYYYCKNKEDLYQTVVCEAYEALCAQIDDQIPEGLDLLDTYYFTVLQLKLLTPEERRVFRLAYKLRAGFDDFDAAASRVRAYEETRHAAAERRIREEIASPVFARLLLHVTNYLMEQAILFGMDLSEQDIRAELELLFAAREG
jgi:AcrR family transcriptional regulator